MTSWLITGGAGYIGSHVIRELINEGNQVVVVDNLSTGFKERIPEMVSFYKLDCKDKKSLVKIATKHKIEGIIHLAAYKHARESLLFPLKYWDNNINAMLGVLSLVETGIVNRFVLSSSCSVYGSNPNTTEYSPLNPKSPYGYTKLVCERMLQDLAKVHDCTYSILRYFNIIGCGDFNLAQDTSSQCLVPRIFEKFKSGSPIEIYGKGLPTRDGTPIRDYLDVRDLAMAHTLIAKNLKKGMEVINISSGRPTTVMEIVSSAINVTGLVGHEINFLEQNSADPSEIWGVTSNILLTHGWKAKRDLSDSLQSHWAKVINPKL